MLNERDISVSCGCMQGCAKDLRSIAFPLRLIERSLPASEFGSVGGIYEVACVALRDQPCAQTGFVHDGWYLFQESELVVDERVKAGLRVLSLKALADSSAKLEKSVLYNLEFLEGKRGPDSIKRNMREGRRTDMLDRIMNELPVDIAYAYVHAIARAGIYGSLGETEALYAVLSEYSLFYESAVKHDSERFEWLQRIEGQPYASQWSIVEQLAL